MIRSKPATSMQKTYDDCYLTCSTAVYFEGQNNEPEALRSWRSALDAIYYHNAYRIPSGWRPRTETERALQDSLRQMEVRCKERVDLLEALRESREGSKKGSSNDLPAATTTAVTDLPASGLTGDGTVPSADHASVPRPTPPPPLPARPPPPKRPSVTARHSNGVDGRSRSSPKMTSTSIFPPPLTTLTPRPETTRKSSRTPSPEKKGMLRTLRSGKDRRERGKLATSLRSKAPAAAKAATQAWTATGFNGSEISLPTPQVEGRTSRQRPERPPPSAVLRKYSEDELAARHASGYSLQDSRRSLDITSKPNALRHKSSMNSIGSLRDSSHEEAEESTGSASDAAPATFKPISMPAYRQEYPTPPPSKYTKPPLATPPRRWDHRASSAPNGAQVTSPTAPRNPANGIPRKAIGVVAAMQARQEVDSSPSDDLPVLEHAKTAPAKSRAKAKPPYDAPRPDPSDNSTTSPPTAANTTTTAEPPSPSDAWAQKKAHVLASLPANIDPAAASQILNEVTHHGDPVTFSDISGLTPAKLALKENVIYPFLRPDLFRGLREPARGILLFGPPGTGKTMLARALATESRSTFFSIGAGSLTSKFLGESEKLVRALFAVAKLCGPSIVFVDEIESLLGRRGEGGHDALERVKTEFLVGWSDLQRAAASSSSSAAEGDGDASRVLVLAATNLPWLIDEAARRRFVRRQYIPLPEAETRRSQLAKLLERQRASISEQELEKLVELTDGFSGSDITSLAKDAAMGPLRALGERLLDMSPDDIRPISMCDFEASLVNIRPSVGKAGLREFEDWAAEFGERGG